MSEVDDYHRHEAMDRTHVLCSNIGDHLLDHPYITAHPELRTAVEDALSKLADVYQRIGVMEQDEPPSEETMKTRCIRILQDEWAQHVPWGDSVPAEVIERALAKMRNASGEPPKDAAAPPSSAAASSCLDGPTVSGNRWSDGG